MFLQWLASYVIHFQNKKTLYFHRLLGMYHHVQRYCHLWSWHVSQFFMISSLILSMILPTYPGKIPQTSPNPQKERTSFINCWWNFWGIFQWYVGENLDFRLFGSPKTSCLPLIWGPAPPWEISPEGLGLQRAQSREQRRQVECHG